MVQYLLFGGQVAVVLLVYVFVWRVMRSARGDLLGAGSGGASGAGAMRADVARASAAPLAQDSTILPAADVVQARRAAGLGEPRLVVEQSDVLRTGVPYTIGGGLSLGRTSANDVVLDEGVVSGRHARIVPPGTVVDDGSTNGTLVNGQLVRGRATLRSGDVLQVGSTVFRYEVPK